MPNGRRFIQGCPFRPGNGWSGRIASLTYLGGLQEFLDGARETLRLVHVRDMPGAGKLDIARALTASLSLRIAAGVTPSFSPTMNSTGRVTFAAPAA